MRAARLNGTQLPEDFIIPSFHHRDQARRGWGWGWGGVETQRVTYR